MKNIELKVNEVANIKRISFVLDPAVEGEQFLYFSNEHTEIFQKVDSEKGLVTGLIMRPNKKIPRINKFTGEQYTVEFSEDTVRDASILYMKGGNQGKTNLEHKYDIEGATLVETYIISNENMNNAKSMGFTDVRKGDWWGTFKVDNEELKKLIKAGTVKGFSVEGTFVDAIATAKEEAEMNAQNFTVEPGETETEKEFISRCIPLEMKAGHEQQQSIAICYSKWENGRMSLSKKDDECGPECGCEYVEEDIIDKMIEVAHDFDKLNDLVSDYLEFGFTPNKYPPVHPNCVCVIVDGVWTVHPENTKIGPEGSPCPMCVKAKANFNKNK